ncbi:hypothetical protein HYT24_00990 [Candidatus Pacearchaeota archaeon]|nr:hypothetical protein [Candidatus Pacearchaeota archaeon]
MVGVTRKIGSLSTGEISDLGKLLKLEELAKEDIIPDDKIKFQLQRLDNDCGHACLDMLGYDGHGTFPPKVNGNGLQREELLSFPNVRRTANIQLSSNPYLETPHMLIVGVIAKKGSAATHWVIGYKDKIYCPSSGIWKTGKYESFLDNVEAFNVPFAA